MSRLTVSFVLFKTPLEEVARAVDQVHDSYADARIVLVDNSPEPNPLPPVDASRVRIVRPGRNVGYGAAHNKAFALSSDCEFHAALNTDLTYGPEVFPALMAFMADIPTAGLVMPRVCYPDGSLQYLCRLLPHPLDVFLRGFARNSRWARERSCAYEFRSWNYEEVQEFPFLSGCFMMLRRSVIEEVGGFDERYFMYGEDVDLSRRIHERYKTLYYPHVTVRHEYRSERPGSKRAIIKAVNLSRYFHKWGWFFDRKRSEINATTIRSVYSHRI